MNAVAARARAHHNADFIVTGVELSEREKRPANGNMIVGVSTLHILYS